MMHIEIAREFIGTPFHPHACIKGVGADCAGLVHHALVESGVIRPLPFLKCRYTPSTNDGHIIQGMFEQSPLPPNSMTVVHAIQVGDILTFNVGGKLRHCSIATDKGHIHSTQYVGVSEGAIAESLLSRINKIYRVTYGA